MIVCVCVCHRNLASTPRALVVRTFDDSRKDLVESVHVELTVPLASSSSSSSSEEVDEAPTIDCTYKEEIVWITNPNHSSIGPSIVRTSIYW